MPTIIYSELGDIVSHNSASNDTLALLGGDDQLTVFNGTVQAFMGEGDDVVSIRGGDTTAFGESGADRFEFYVGGFAGGGSGDDVFNIRGGAGITARGDSGDDRFNFASAASTVLMLGGIGNDSFAGGNLAITGDIRGEIGNDLFTGFRAGATLFGGSGDDVYRVNPLSNATFTELAGEGSDIVQLMRGADFVLPANIERIIVGTYAGSDGSAATITMNGLANAFTGHGNDETVSGLAGTDRLFGKAGNDTLNGGDDNDLLDGGSGNDVLNGDNGNDVLVGRTGDDSMAGGAGNDLYYVDTALDTTLEGIGQGTDTVRFTLTNYTLGANIEIGIATVAAATVHGNLLGNSLYGTSGDDFLYGEDGNDHLYGRAGNDYLEGGSGDDTLRGEAGGDNLFGGAGLDRYFYYAVSDSPSSGPWDYITIDSEDYINLNGVDADSTTAGNQDFTMVAGPTSVPGQMWVEPFMSLTGFDPITLMPIFTLTGYTIYGDVNGDGGGDLIISTGLGLDSTHIIG